MSTLHQLGEHSYYIDGPAKVGLVKVGEQEVCLIDSGNDKDAGRRIKRLLEEKGWNLRSIFNTHSNADHVGGNRYLQQQTGCSIYAPGMECALTRHPLLEPSFIFGGYPPKELRHKFFIAQESKVDYLTREALPQGMESIPLPGHFFNMVGFRTMDDVVYLADCLSSKETLEKYQMVFLYDVAAQLDTLRMVRELQARFFVPSHAPVMEDVSDLVQINIEKIEEIGDRILELCHEPMIFEEVLQKLFRHYGLTLNFDQYALVGSTIRSTLVWLKEAERMEAYFEDNRLLWRSW